MRYDIRQRKHASDWEQVGLQYLRRARYIAAYKVSLRDQQILIPPVRLPSFAVALIGRSGTAADTADGTFRAFEFHQLAEHDDSPSLELLHVERPISVAARMQTVDWTTTLSPTEPLHPDLNVNIEDEEILAQQESQVRAQKALKTERRKLRKFRSRRKKKNELFEEMQDALEAAVKSVHAISPAEAGALLVNLDAKLPKEKVLLYRLSAETELVIEFLLQERRQQMATAITHCSERLLHGKIATTLYPWRLVQSPPESDDEGSDSATREKSEKKRHLWSRRKKSTPAADTVEVVQREDLIAISMQAIEARVGRDVVAVAPGVDVTQPVLYATTVAGAAKAASKSRGLFSKLKHMMHESASEETAAEGGEDVSQMAKQDTNHWFESADKLWQALQNESKSYP